MTDKQLKEAISQLPQGEEFVKSYATFEGGIRLIFKKADGAETRYKVSFDSEDNAIITQF